MDAHLQVRPVVPEDLPILRSMRADAVNWDASRPFRTVAQVTSIPELGRYLDGWPRSGDAGVVAEQGDSAVGAAWFRIFEADAPGYGFIDTTIPELTIAVAEGARGNGVGRLLINALLEQVRALGHVRLSLSVEKENPAASWYLRLGFRVEGGHGDAWTMSIEI
jgi:GNAT superfamily N-acetyltransferase